MNIVVTLAGHSRRFRKAGYNLPKFLIPIDGSPMIAHVVDMFDPKDKFHFVLNQEQLKNHPETPNILKSLVPRGKMHVIEPHELGPTHSALQVKDIAKEEEAIVTYCDFRVDWNYKQFLNKARHHDAALPVFRGFHPASFGNTLYAYVRTQGEKFLELREKQSFTENRVEEFASVGIYYFSRWSLFNKYAKRLLQAPPSAVKEYYVSLMYNLMAEDGLGITVDEVEKFICWGTPEDLDHYLYWLNYFKREKSTKITKKRKTKCVNLIPMAGRGQRFKNWGYRVTKPLIQINGDPMILSCVSTFPKADEWVFLAQQNELKRHPIKKAIQSKLPNSQFIVVDGDTGGMANTCLLAESTIPSNAEVLVASCDYQAFFQRQHWERVLEDKSIDGAIWTYRLKNMLFKNPNAFAYCKTEPNTSTVQRVVEKKTISNSPELDPMVVGTFWYRRAEDLFRGIRKMIANRETINGEYYVGTSINSLIEEGAKFVIFDIEQWVSFGDPFELRVLEYWEEHFQSEREPPTA